MRPKPRNIESLPRPCLNPKPQTLNAEIKVRPKLRNLENLVLSNNRIDAIPEELFDLETLKQVDPQPSTLIPKP